MFPLRKRPALSPSWFHAASFPRGTIETNSDGIITTVIVFCSTPTSVIICISLSSSSAGLYWLHRAGAPPLPSRPRPLGCAHVSRAALLPPGPLRARHGFRDHHIFHCNHLDLNAALVDRYSIHSLQGARNSELHGLNGRCGRKTDGGSPRDSEQRRERGSRKRKGQQVGRNR